MDWTKQEQERGSPSPRLPPCACGETIIFKQLTPPVSSIFPEGQLLPPFS